MSATSPPQSLRQTFTRASKKIVVIKYQRANKDSSGDTEMVQKTNAILARKKEGLFVTVVSQPDAEDKRDLGLEKGGCICHCQGSACSWVSCPQRSLPISLCTTAQAALPDKVHQVLHQQRSTVRRTGHVPHVPPKNCFVETASRVVDKRRVSLPCRCNTRRIRDRKL